MYIYVETFKKCMYKKRDVLIAGVVRPLFDSLISPTYAINGQES